MQTRRQGCLQAQQIGQLGGCWGMWTAGASLLVPLLAHVPSPACVPLPSLSPTGAGTVSSTLSHPWDKPGKVPRVWLGAGPPSLLQESPWAAQGALAGEQGWCQLHSSPAECSQQILLRSSSRKTPLMSHLPCALAQILILPHPCSKSHIHFVCNEGDCQISYLRGNLLSFIELPITGPGLLRAISVTSMRC